MLRELSVHATSGYKYKETPTIQLKGSYLEQFGFSIGTSVTVFIENNQIVIKPTKDKVEIEM